MSGDAFLLATVVKSEIVESFFRVATVFCSLSFQLSLILNTKTNWILGILPRPSKVFVDICVDVMEMLLIACLIHDEKEIGTKRKGKRKVVGLVQPSLVLPIQRN